MKITDDVLLTKMRQEELEKYGRRSGLPLYLVIVKGNEVEYKAFLSVKCKDDYIKSLDIEYEEVMTFITDVKRCEFEI